MAKRSRRFSLSKPKKVYLIAGFGAGAGILVPYIIKQYAESTLPIPLPPPLNQASTAGAIFGGAGMLLVALMAKKEQMKAFSLCYGITSLIYGVWDYIHYTTQARLRNSNYRYPVGLNRWAQPRPAYLRATNSTMGRVITGRSASGNSIRPPKSGLGNQPWRGFASVGSLPIKPSQLNHQTRTFVTGEVILA
jgi:hypothetical protein